MSAPPPQRTATGTTPSALATSGAARFRCQCGRSVATIKGSLADESRQCSRCRRHALRADAPLHRTV